MWSTTESAPAPVPWAVLWEYGTGCILNSAQRVQGSFSAMLGEHCFAGDWTWGLCMQGMASSALDYLPDRWRAFQTLEHLPAWDASGFGHLLCQRKAWCAACTKHGSLIWAGKLCKQLPAVLQPGMCEQGNNSPHAQLNECNPNQHCKPPNWKVCDLWWVSTMPKYESTSTWRAVPHTHHSQKLLWPSQQAVCLTQSLLKH